MPGQKVLGIKVRVSGRASAAQCSAQQGDQESRSTFSNRCVKMNARRIVLPLTENGGALRVVSRNKLKNIHCCIN